MTQNARLHVVDALRGFSIVAIMLLHNIEHFDVYYTAEGIPVWMQAIDRVIWDSLFFLFGGKVYAIFALLFGLTFHIQRSNQLNRGKSFDGRFTWRLLLLLGFGLINSAFFQGDILGIYALLGFLLIPLGKLSNKAIFAIATLLLLLPLEWVSLVRAMQNPEMPINDPVSWTYFGRMGEYIFNGSLLDVIMGNLTNGKIAVLIWNKENGRFFLILSYFLFGILAGRKNLFVYTEKSKKFWMKGLAMATILFLPVYIFNTQVNGMIESEAIRRSAHILVSTWSNTAFMVVLVSGFTLLFQSKVCNKALSYFSAFGKMSLSNYVGQSIIGSFIYYGFGLGLYKYTGATYGLLIGVGLTMVFGIFCTWWAKNYKRGPLEGIWHKLTWINLKQKA